MPHYVPKVMLMMSQPPSVSGSLGAVTAVATGRSLVVS